MGRGRPGDGDGDGGGEGRPRRGVVGGKDDEQGIGRVLEDTLEERLERLRDLERGRGPPREPDGKFTEGVDDRADRLEEPTDRAQFEAFVEGRESGVRVAYRRGEEVVEVRPDSVDPKKGGERVILGLGDGNKVTIRVPTECVYAWYDPLDDAGG